MMRKYRNIIQWLIIILLAIFCFHFWRSSKVSEEKLIEEVQFDKNERQHVAITNDKSLRELKKINEELYDSIKHLSNVKEAVQIKYVTRYKTDTVAFPVDYVPKDSIYHYSEKNDSVNYDLKIKATDVEWFNLDISIRDSLMLVTRSKNGQNETTVSHNENTKIVDVTVFTPKKKFSQKVKDNLYFGVGVGMGYGVINKKPDIYIGINAGIKF